MIGGPTGTPGERKIDAHRGAYILSCSSTYDKCVRKLQDAIPSKDFFLWYSRPTRRREPHLARALY